MLPGQNSGQASMAPYPCCIHRAGWATRRESTTANRLQSFDTKDQAVNSRPHLSRGPPHASRKQRGHAAQTTGHATPGCRPHLRESAERVAAERCPMQSLLVRRAPLVAAASAAACLTPAAVQPASAALRTARRAVSSYIAAEAANGILDRDEIFRLARAARRRRRAELSACSRSHAPRACSVRGSRSGRECGLLAAAL
jgi:hypothetical protein